MRQNIWKEVGKYFVLQVCFFLKLSFKDLGIKDFDLIPVSLGSIFESRLSWFKVKIFEMEY